VATIADVAQAAGVSIATVSRVLSSGPRHYPVRPETAERVRAAAAALNFVPSPLARGLATNRSGLLGLLVPDLADPHYPHIASGVEDSARAAELSVLICNTLGSHQRLAEYLRLLQARRVDAIVLCGGSTLGPEEVATLELLAGIASATLVGLQRARLAGTLAAADRAQDALRCLMGLAAGYAQVLAQLPQLPLGGRQVLDQLLAATAEMQETVDRLGRLTRRQRGARRGPGSQAGSMARAGAAHWRARRRG
jgi:LacI family transcriptional regulator